ncbi:MAG: CvpA family protein [Acidobacteriota bacterium]|nr:CvpA family protein [Acidobacteriota bacterium]
MNALDWLLAGILVLSAIHAAAQGFVFESFSLAGTILGYLIAAWGYRSVAGFLTPYIKSDIVAAGVGFLLIFVVIAILSGMLGRIVRWAAHSVGLRGMDRLLGALFGLVRGGVVVMVLVMAMAAFFPSSPALAKSEIGQFFLVAGQGAVYAGPGDLKEKFREGLKGLRTMQHPGQ